MPSSVSDLPLRHATEGKKVTEGNVGFLLFVGGEARAKASAHATEGKEVTEGNLGFLLFVGGEARAKASAARNALRAGVR